MNKNAYEKIINILNQNSIKYKVYEHEEVFTINDVKNKLLFDYNKLVKTIVFSHKEKFIFVVLNGDNSIDYKKLSKALNIRRDDFKMANGEEIEKELGYQIGGISPIPTESNIVVIIDKKVLDKEKIYCGIGVRTKSLELKSSDLVKVAGAEVSDITK